METKKFYQDENWTARIVETGGHKILLEESRQGVFISCLHTKNSWNADGTRLTCDFCGSDGT